MGRRAVFCSLLEKKAISPLGARCGIVLAMSPLQTCPSLSQDLSLNHHSCMCGQVTYEHQCINIHSFMKEGKLG